MPPHTDGRRRPAIGYAVARLVGSIILMLAMLGAGTASAAGPTAHAVLFFSPTCPHCHIVMEQVFPPLQEHYGDQLQILTIDVTQPDGQALYQTAITTFAITEDRLGVPTLVIGKDVMVGSEEIPARFPALIVAALSAGGNDWPAIPGIAAQVGPDTTQADLVSPVAPELSPFQRDPLANGVALVLLLLMVGSVLLITVTARPPSMLPRPPWQEWAIPALSVAGMAVALYLAFVEMSGGQAVCGPVGDCNTVQQSEYARLFGVLPIGVLGVVGYAVILAAWALRRTTGSTADLAAKAIPAMAFLGTLFSIYLTYLEPFVIGATCMWCLTSAALMLALLWITAPRHMPEVQRGKGRRAGAH
jgi:uncharacterized membrane protein/thiol-disulfide isomerase/thioredoxin